MSYKASKVEGLRPPPAFCAEKTASTAYGHSKVVVPIVRVP